MKSTACWIPVLILSAAAGFAAGPAANKQPVLDCYISTGDNHWLGDSLPVDSKAGIEASFDLLKRLGVRRVYWRGLEEACWLDTMRVREENCRYASYWKWTRQVYRDADPDRTAAEAAHKRGMEIWGVGTLFDWGNQADSPGFNDFPWFAESRLRIEHPEWVPVDRSGLLKQGGPVEFAYPEARRALVDLHMKHMQRDGYDGMAFLTYAENYSTRFQDEFGFNEPVVGEFQKRTGLDIRAQPFTRIASREDWYALRGEYVTAYLRELKAELAKSGKKLGLFLNPWQPHFPQPWNVPELMLTGGHIYFDLETWVREGIVDQFIVYGYCHAGMQARAMEDMLWMTRQTPVAVTGLTSSPFAARWQPFADRGVPVALSVNDDDAYLDRSNVPAQPLASLQSGDSLLRLKALSQIIHGQLKATAADVAPLAGDKNLLVRRMGLMALAKLKDPQALPAIEQALEDPENCVRCAAARALRDFNRPESAAKLLAAVNRFGNHMLCELVVHTLPRIKPAPRDELADAAVNHKNAAVRQVAMRALVNMADETLVATFAKGISDSDRFVRFAAAEALGNVRHSAAAVETLLAATRHEDVVVSDRAATSLAAMAVRHEKETEPLMQRVVMALKDLFARLGDGCARADADWGYRPVGNALLRLALEGEAVLQAFMDQRQDKRLAGFAWKTLHIRQDKGTFSEITEKENDEAFKKRPEFGKELRVDPAGGDDTSAAGPFKTIARAIKLAAPGDTIHLAPAHYRECAVFVNKSGEPGRPITLDGHGATLDGAEPLKPGDWETVSPGLYRNRSLLRVDPAVLMRWFFVFDGRMNHMGRTSKGPSKPLKKPEELAPGEWTYVPDEPLVRKSEGGKPWDARKLAGAFYIKIDPEKTLADYRIEAPVRQNGVSLSGRCEHLEIRNVISTHVHNDGFNIHGYTRDIYFKNIKAVDCGDDGVSAHDDCQIRVNGLVSVGNSTGACDIGNSVTHYNRVFIKGCLGYDFFMLGSNAHSLSNSVIESSAARCVVIETERAGSNTVCTVAMDNVLIHRVAGTNDFRVGKGAVFNGRRLTLAGLNFLAADGSTGLHNSVVAGAPQPEINIRKGARWQADGNLYDAHFIRLDQTFYSAKTFADYQRATGQDKSSRWSRVEFKQPFNGQAAKPAPGQGVGADVSQLPSGLPDKP